MITPQLMIKLLVILVAAWLLGGLFTRYGLPAMLGELLAGVILGPPLLGVVTSSPPIDLIAEFGIFFIMFHTGMEMDPKELIKHIWASTTVALGGFVLPFVLGYFTTRIFGGTLFQSLYVGICISVTAIAVQSVILHSMKIHKTYIGHIIIGAAIVDDILSLIGLSVLLGITRTGAVETGNLVLVVFKVISFFAFTIIAGHFVVPRFTRKLHDREGRAFTFAMVSALVMAYLAELAGLHMVIGAFLAGQFVREEIMDKRIYESISDRFYGLSYGFLAPIFFASLSFHLHFYVNWHFIIFSVVLIAVAIIGKMVGCGLGLALFRPNLWESAIIGLGMNGRGAVELVIASVVLKLSSNLMSSGAITEPLLTDFQFSALILMAFVTTLLAPFSLKWAVMNACQPDEKTDFCQLWNNK